MPIVQRYLLLLFLLFVCGSVSLESAYRNPRELTTKNLNVSSSSNDPDPCGLEGRSGMAYHRKTRKCYEINSVGPCGENMKFYTTIWPTVNYGECFCDRELPCVYNSTTGKCHALFHQDYCDEGFWLQLNGNGNLGCYSNPCLNRTNDSGIGKFVILNGACAKFGEACGIGRIVGFRIGKFEAECKEEVRVTPAQNSRPPLTARLLSIAPPIPTTSKPPALANPLRSVTATLPPTPPLPLKPLCSNQTTELGQNCLNIIDDEYFRIAALIATNEYRIRHKAPPLTQDVEVDGVAQKYAEKLAAESSFVHSMDKQYGENLYYYIGPRKSNTELIFDAIKAFYDEIKDYDYNLPGFSSATAHFTQLIWRTTKKQGVGIARNPKSGYSVVVINYLPPGNWEGEYFENVWPPASNFGASDDALFTLY